jgi:hypothetical protein
MFLLALSACTGVNTRTADGRGVRMTRAEFAEYVETTFRHHNRVVNELITASILGDEEIPIDPALIRAEEDMDASCQPLNEMVTATIEGRELSFWAKMRLLDQVPLCEAATRRVEAMIPAAF